MSRLKIMLLACGLLWCLTGLALAQDAQPQWSDLPAGEWTQMLPGGDTICSNGTPYSYFVRPAATESDKLLIHFQGGGACWFGQICDIQGENPTYDPFVDESDHPINYAGIFNFDNEENPFADYNMVMVPYCTADVHVGNTDTTYEIAATDTTPAKEVTIFHRGYVNATTVLDWTFNNVADPDTVFVTGCSAGSIPSPFYAAMIAEQYPAARIEQLGDASGGYRNPTLAQQIWANWGTLDILPESYAEAGITIDNLTFETFYQMTGSMYPEITMTQYNTAGDAVQLGFLALSGMTDTPLIDLLEPNFADIKAEVEDFHTFTAGGDGHCITPTDDFYNIMAGDMRLVEWVAMLANGDAVTDAKCEDCAAAEMGE